MTWALPPVSPIEFMWFIGDNAFVERVCPCALPAPPALLLPLPLHRWRCPATIASQAHTTNSSDQGTNVLVGAGDMVIIRGCRML